jgi:5'-nucleotidase / UDP-sugar diphosphatase
MKHLKKLLTMILAIALVLIPVAPVKASLVPQADLDLKGYRIIMHTNDSHGRAVPNSGSGYMGFTAVSALKKGFEAAGAEVILLDAGDTLHGLPFANLVQGKSIVSLMNQAGYDAMTPGNHDFNYGSDTLLELSKDMKFQLISANVKDKSTGKNFLTPKIVIDKNGYRYGIFGLSTPETEYLTNPNNVSSLEFGDPIQAAKDQVEELKKNGVTYIIALTHLGIDKSSKVTSQMVAEQVDGINLIVDGHSHSTLEHGLKVNNTLIVSTGDYLQNIGVVAISPQGKVEASLVNPSLFTGTDPAIDELVASYSSEQDEILSEVIGHTNVELDGVREHVRASETNLGDLAADAFRKATGADVAITNGGGIRASIAAGDITRKDIVTVFPFGNYIVTKKVTGEALLQALEHGVSTCPEPLGAFLQISGITCTVDVTRPVGSRITNIKVNGKALNLQTEYLLATNDFVVAGGDGYSMLADFPVVNEYGAMEDILIDYLKTAGDIEIQKDNRITIVGASEEEPAAPAAEPVEPEQEDVVVPEEEAVVEEQPETDAVSEEGFVIYVVKKGDNLTEIAAEVLGSGSLWKEIYHWNKTIIKDPDRIYIGQELKIFTDLN